MPNGNAVTNITIATSETWKDKNTGQQQEKTEWHRITFYQRLAEIVAEYVKKGSKLYVEGRLQTRSWEQDGIKRYATDIIANEMQMLDSRGGSNASGDYSGGGGGYQQQAPQAQAATPASAPQQAPAGMDNGSFDDDIPF